MDYEKLAARCVIAGIQGPTPTPEELDLVRRGIAGVILFKRNVVDPSQVAELSRTLKAAAPGPLLISIDQEGGRVQRLRPPHWTEVPSARRLGELDALGGAAGMNGTAIAEKLGLLIAEELSACGIDQDYAPVLDVDTNPDNPVIGDRSFGRDPARVARLGTALGRGLEAGRVASCGKHFPGHGDTSQDSHLELPVVAGGPEDLEVALRPFRAAIAAGVRAVMTAHLVVPSAGPEPATLNPAILSALLRDRLGFDGLVITDGLEMA
ncbi:MAG TPA: beta-N-acetylhexosaminidase, partial [Myxococcales bacterium]|nr:beta-N-acetylhexosaminidase [Myxococcales bacterium]